MLIAVFFALSASYFLFILAGYFWGRKLIRNRLPVGSEYSIALSDDSMCVKDALVATEVSYKLYKSVRATKDVVGLNPKLGRVPTLVPRELFTPESLAWLTTTVRGS